MISLLLPRTVLPIATPLSSLPKTVAPLAASTTLKAASWSKLSLDLKRKRLPLPPIAPVISKSISTVTSPVYA